jgi:stearoyl-CoA desaturase (delta-9 desaturase)
MASSSLASKEAPAFPDGTTDCEPLRSNTKYNPQTVHIADTPMTWSNVHLHVNWLNTTLIIIIPILGFISAYWVPIRLYTAIWAILFYFNTGLGITAGESFFKCAFFFSLIVDVDLPAIL